jgi:hypothetical protein
MKKLSGAALVFISACNIGSEAAFIDTAQLDICTDEIPICNTTAGCVLVEEEGYIEGEFPGQKSFIVPTEGEAVIRVRLLWRERLGPGSDTEIIWHEPACVEDYAYESQGADVFADTNEQGIFVKEQRVFRAGEHLVEIRSDATATYLLRTEVLTKKEYEAEQRDQEGLFGGDEDAE